jgi:two-component system, cell cycle sensor histidine kinase and response regulator CckA
LDRLPLFPARKDGAKVPSSSGVVILVADDEELVRNLVAVVVRSDGYQVLIASDGEQALELSRRYDGHIHLLISDIVMPGMSGIELANLLKLERPEIEVLLISGYPDVSVPPAFQFLAKPFTPVKLREVMVKLLVHRDGGSKPRTISR